VSETEIQPSPLIYYIYKTSEIKVDIPIFVAMPKLSETAKKITQGQNILIIEGSTETPEVIDKIKTEIEDRINQINQKTFNETKNQQPDNKPETTSFFSKLRGIKNRT
jgi:pyridoxal biosynthesis lyase PdxS